jgi:hypothetical protein
MPLINPDYASAASAQMVQHRLGDFETHAEALQPRRALPLWAKPLPHLHLPVGCIDMYSFINKIKGLLLSARKRVK